MFEQVDLARAYRTVPSGLFLISSSRDGQANVQFAFRGLGIWETPPLVLVGIQHSNWSHETIQQTGEFVLNVCGEAQVAAIDRSRGLSARNTEDKFAALGLTPLPAQQIAAPLVAGCHASLECRVRAALPAAETTLFLADVLVCHVDDSVRPVARFMGQTFRLDGPLR